MIESSRRHLVYAITLVVATAWVILDQATKMAAVRTYATSPPDDLGPVVLRLIYNEGGAFSLPIRLPWVFVAVTVLVCVLVARALPETTSRGLAAAYGLVVGGAIGNASDRIFRDGAVVDMIDLDFPPLQSFPVFNVADIGITVGAVLVAVMMIQADRREQAAVLEDEAPDGEVDPVAGIDEVPPGSGEPVGVAEDTTEG
ncbi:MAG TPA: signal peptidase II [Euzebya sp.]|nr:signal peptidase II [Euzebya sp.]